MEIKRYVLPVEAFQFSKISENETKQDKRKFKRGLSVTLVVKNA